MCKDKKDKDKGERKMPVALRELPRITDKNAARISDMIRHNNKRMEERKKQLRKKLYDEKH